MNADKLSQRWFLAAITYFVIAVAFGVYMGASGDHALYSVHSHISLVGWVSMALTGMLYRIFPAAARSRLVAAHFWLYQLAAPVMLLAVAALESGVERADPIAGISSMVLLASVLLFWWILFAARRERIPAETP